MGEPMRKKRKVVYNNNNNANQKNKGQNDDKALPRFLQHIWTMLHDSSLNHIISWHSTLNHAFVVHKQNLFCQQILPKFFKHNKFTSFVRQLNMYQFHKLRDEKPMTWSHIYLEKNKYSQLQFIQRRISNTNQSQSSHPSMNANYKNLSKLANENKNKIALLQEYIKQIRNDINVKFDTLRRELITKLDAFCAENRIRHVPPPINEVKKGTNVIYVDNETHSSSMTMCSNNNNNYNNHQNAVKYINNSGNGNNGQVVYVTNGAAQCMPVDLMSAATMQAPASNPSPYIITNNGPSAATITLLNISNNNNMPNNVNNSILDIRNYSYNNGNTNTCNL